MLKIAEMLGLPVWALFLVATLAGTVAGAWGMAKFKNGEIASIELAHAEEKHQAFMAGRARQLASDAATRTISDDFHVTNVAIIRRTQTIQKEIPIYVQDDATCITWGLVRVHNAAAAGADPNTLDIAAGQSNETCAGIGWHQLTETIVGNYGKYHEVSDQLTHLQDWVDAQISIQNSSPQVPGGSGAGADDGGTFE